MCKWGTHKKVNVIRKANPFEINDGWHETAVDSCIAAIVQKMNNEGIITLQSCCGHGTQRGYIWIAHEAIDMARRLGYAVEMVDFSHSTIYEPERKLQDGRRKLSDLIDYRIEPFIYVDSMKPVEDELVEEVAEEIYFVY